MNWPCGPDVTAKFRDRVDELLVIQSKTSNERDVFESDAKELKSSLAATDQHLSKVSEFSRRLLEQLTKGGWKDERNHRIVKNIAFAELLAHLRHGYEAVAGSSVCGRCNRHAGGIFHK